MEMIALEEIIVFHEKIIEKTGGRQGVRDIGLIESAINRPFQTYDGVELYPEIKSKISAITYSLINNHGFVDGNKRIGVSVMLLLLRLNNIGIKYRQKEKPPTDDESVGGISFRGIGFVFIVIFNVLCSYVQQNTNLGDQ